MKGPTSKIRRRGKYGILNKISIITTKTKRIKDKELNLIKQLIIKSKNNQFLIHPNKHYTQKGILIRMGKGKGKIKGQYCKVFKHKILIVLNNHQFNFNHLLKKLPYLHIKK